ncbi:MAG: threonine--tRNA ligase, partial [Acholeplasmataceae bacterium]|nr:threonine--tRNA ligase [Acholeplasmataceae bacterium]
LTYIDSDGEKKRPVMLHRALFGSIERFIGILIEHYGGAFPTWLSPVQIMVIPVNLEYHKEYAKGLVERLQAENLRVELDLREEKLGYLIRDAQTKKIPYQLVIGDMEMKNDSLTYRRYGASEQTQVSVKEFIAMIKTEIKNK